jgi:hypothetical protein
MIAAYAQVMRALFLLTLSLTACAPAFQEMDPGEKRAGELTLLGCGASTVTTSGVIKAMDEPPVGPGNDEVKPTPVRVCLKLTNRGSQPAKVDRSHVLLDTPHGKLSWVQDKDDEVFVVPAGESKTFAVDFETTMLLKGEDVKVRVSDAITIGGRASGLPPITLRRR